MQEEQTLLPASGVRSRIKHSMRSKSYTSDQVMAMAYFDQAKETKLVTDLLLMVCLPFCPNREKKTDKLLPMSADRYQALAIVWVIECLHLCLCGGHFMLHTDCNPVELIFSNTSLKQPERIECWNLHLQGHDFSITNSGVGEGGRGGGGGAPPPLLDMIAP